MNRSARRPLTTLLVAPILAAALFATAAPAQSEAEMGGAPCGNSMAMPQTKAPTAAPNMMTRAGQVGARTPAPRSDAAMAPGCPTTDHG